MDITVVRNLLRTELIQVLPDEVAPFLLEEIVTLILENGQQGTFTTIECVVLKVSQEDSTLVTKVRTTLTCYLSSILLTIGRKLGTPITEEMILDEDL